MSVGVFVLIKTLWSAGSSAVRFTVTRHCHLQHKESHATIYTQTWRHVSWLVALSERLETEWRHSPLLWGCFWQAGTAAAWDHEMPCRKKGSSEYIFLPCNRNELKILQSPLGSFDEEMNRLTCSVNLWLSGAVSLSLFYRSWTFSTLPFVSISNLWFNLSRTQIFLEKNYLLHWKYNLNIYEKMWYCIIHALECWSQSGSKLNLWIQHQWVIIITWINAQWRLNVSEMYYRT